MEDRLDNPGIRDDESVDTDIKIEAFDEGEGFDEGQGSAGSSSTSIHHADSSGPSRSMSSEDRESIGETTTVPKEETATARCGVCEIPLQKPSTHYGGVTCLSCRAFFRRGIQKGVSSMCLRGGTCSVRGNSRKICSNCRMRKCFENGMSESKILTDDQKQVRFRKLHAKKASQRGGMASGHPNGIATGQPGLPGSINLLEERPSSTASAASSIQSTSLRSPGYNMPGSSFMTEQPGRRLQVKPVSGQYSFRSTSPSNLFADTPSKSQQQQGGGTPVSSQYNFRIPSPSSGFADRPKRSQQAIPVSSHFAPPVSGQYATPVSSQYASPVSSHFATLTSSHYARPVSSHLATSLSSHNAVPTSSYYGFTSPSASPSPTNIRSSSPSHLFTHKSPGSVQPTSVSSQYSFRTPSPSFDKPPPVLKSISSSSEKYSFRNFQNAIVAVGTMGKTIKESGVLLESNEIYIDNKRVVAIKDELILEDQPDKLDYNFCKSELPDESELEDVDMPQPGSSSVITSHCILTPRTQFPTMKSPKYKQVESVKVDELEALRRSSYHADESSTSSVILASRSQHQYLTARDGDSEKSKIEQLFYNTGGKQPGNFRTDNLLHTNLSGSFKHNQQIAKEENRFRQKLMADRELVAGCSRKQYCGSTAGSEDDMLDGSYVDFRRNVAVQGNKVSVIMFGTQGSSSSSKQGQDKCRETEVTLQLSSTTTSDMEQDSQVFSEEEYLSAMEIALKSDVDHLENYLSTAELHYLDSWNNEFWTCFKSVNQGEEMWKSCAESLGKRYFTPELLRSLGLAQNMRIRKYCFNVTLKDISLYDKTAIVRENIQFPMNAIFTWSCLYEPDIQLFMAFGDKDDIIVKELGITGFIDCKKAVDYFPLPDDARLQCQQKFNEIYELTLLKDFRILSILVPLFMSCVSDYSKYQNPGEINSIHKTCFSLLRRYFLHNIKNKKTSAEAFVQAQVFLQKTAEITSLLECLHLNE